MDRIQNAAAATWIFVRTKLLEEAITALVAIVIAIFMNPIGWQSSASAALISAALILLLLYIAVFMRHLVRGLGADSQPALYDAFNRPVRLAAGKAIRIDNAIHKLGTLALCLVVAIFVGWLLRTPDPIGALSKLGWSIIRNNTGRLKFSYSEKQEPPIRESIEYFRHVQEPFDLDLNARNSLLPDVSLLRQASNLEKIQIWSASPRQLDGIGSITQLKHLIINGADQVSDVSSLSALSDLEELTLRARSVTDITPIGGLTKLERLNLMSTNVTDINALRSLPSLNSVDLFQTRVSDLSPLRELPNLTDMFIGCKQVADIGQAARLKKLHIVCRDRVITSVASLTGLAELQDLKIEAFNIDAGGFKELRAPITTLSLQCLRTDRATNLFVGSIANFDQIGTLTQLTNLDVSFTSVSDIATLANLKDLQKLQLSQCPLLLDLGPLKTLGRLEEITLNYSAVRDLSALMSLPRLRILSVAGTPAVSLARPGIDSLTKRGVTVRY
jgi:hypothetical protein